MPYVEILDKGEANPYEKFVIFKVYQEKPQEGKPPRIYQRDADDDGKEDLEHAAVLQAKAQYERKTGRTLVRFRRDPLAGGMHAAVPPKGQVINRSGTRYRFKGHNDGVYSETQVEGNLEPGNDIMIATPAWVAEYL